MDHHRAGRESICVVMVLSTSILEFETFGKLEIKLYRCTLESPLQGILDSNVNLRAIESTITRIKLPFSGISAIQDSSKLLDPELDYRISGLIQRLTFSAASQVATSPRNFSGRVDNSA